MRRPSVAELRVADDPVTWERLGFTVEDGVAQVGSVAVRPVGDRPATSWQMGADLLLPGRPGPACY